jgi:hypothetical protein
VLSVDGPAKLDLGQEFFIELNRHVYVVVTIFLHPLLLDVGEYRGFGVRQLLDIGETQARRVPFQAHLRHSLVFSGTVDPGEIDRCHPLRLCVLIKPVAFYLVQLVHDQIIADRFKLSVVYRLEISDEGGEKHVVVVMIVESDELRTVCYKLSELLALISAVIDDELESPTRLDVMKQGEEIVYPFTGYSSSFS